MKNINTDRLKELQIVRIRNPYATLELEKTQKLFAQILALKKIGYSKAYGEDSLALGVEDFISDHLLLCFKKDLRPIMGIRATDLKTCQLYKVKFPPFEILDPIENSLHYNAIENIVEQSHNRSINLGYSGGWTIDPNLRHDRELFDIAKEITAAVMCLHYITCDIPEIVGGAVTNFKVDKKLHNPLGFKNINYQGDDLPPIDCKLIKGNSVIWQHLTSFSDEAIERAEAFSYMWAAKLDITCTEVKNAFKKVI